MKNYSIWKNIDKSKYYDEKVLDKNLDCEVLIVGGGITGISTYFHLVYSGINAVLVEQNKVGMGLTANSTGKLTYLQDSIYNKIIESRGVEDANTYLFSQRQALSNIVNIIDKFKIECDLNRVSSFVYASSDKQIKGIEELKKFLINNKINVILENKGINGDSVALRVDDTYMFHPLKFLYNLIKKAKLTNIYENTRLNSWVYKDGYYECCVNNNIIKAKYLVIASHYPYFITPYLFPLKSTVEKSYLIAGNKKMNDFSMISFGNPSISMRTYKDYVLYLDNTHNICTNKKDADCFLNVIKKGNRLGISPEYIWSNNDVITNDHLPYIGYIGNNLLLATGYNTWGLTNGYLAGEIISELITHKEHKFKSLFDPRRDGLLWNTQTFNNIVYSARSIISGKEKNFRVLKTKIDGINVYVYYDRDGEHIVKQKCPHLGCTLKFNEIEKTWDCPCHGSRFDLDGRYIYGPTNKDITFKK